jgi:hypothetical protein
MKIDAEEITLAKLAEEYADPTTARTLLESWVWPKGPVCPHCHSKEVYRLTAKPGSKSGVREGVLKCACIA